MMGSSDASQYELFSCMPVGPLAEDATRQWTTGDYVSGLGWRKAWYRGESARRGRASEVLLAAALLIHNDTATHEVAMQAAWRMRSAVHVPLYRKPA